MRVKPNYQGLILPIFFPSHKAIANQKIPTGKAARLTPATPNPAADRPAQLQAPN